MENLASRLKWARKEAGITQGELAIKCGIRQSAIGNLEAGSRFSAKNIALIAHVLKVNALWLETGKGSPHSDVSPQQPEINLENNPDYLSLKSLHPDIKAVIKIMEGTDDDGKALIRIKTSELAFKREQFLHESKSFDLEKLMQAQGLLSTSDISKKTQGEKK